MKRAGSFVCILFTAIIIVFTCLNTGTLIAQSADVDRSKDTAHQKEFNPINNTPEENFEILEQNLKFYESKSDWLKYIEYLNNKSYLFYFIGDYSNFISHSKMALERTEELLEKGSSLHINAMLMRAIAVELTGDYAQAIKLQTACAKLTDKPDIRIYAHENNGISYEGLGDHEEAIQNYGHALALLDQLPESDPHDKARILRQTAFCHKETGRVEEALALYLKSLNILQDLPDKTYYRQTRWFAYQELADLYLAKEKMDSALLYSNKAIAIQQTTNGLIKSYLTYTTHGELWLAQNNFEKAFSAFDEALQLAEKEHSDFDKHPSFAVCLRKKAEAYLKKGDLATALKLSQQALQKNAVNFNADDTNKNPKNDQYIIKRDGLEILSAKADILTQLFAKNGDEKHLRSAFDTFCAAQSLIQSIRQDYLADGSKHELAKEAIDIYEKAIAASLLLYQNTSETKYLEDAFKFSESNKSVHLFESIRDEMAKGYANIPDSLLTKENDLSIELNYYQKLIKEELQKGENKENQEIKKWENQVFNYRKEYQELTAHLEENFPNYFEKKYKNQSIDVQYLQDKILDHNSAIIEFMVGQNHVFAFFVTKNNLQTIEIKQKESFRDKTRQLRELISSQPDDQEFSHEYTEFTNLSNDLYQLLLKEGLEALPANINQLIIVPDDILCYLPFEILIKEKPNSQKPNYSPKNLSYLFEEYHIGYQYSVSLMTTGNKPAPPSEKAGKFVGFAPDFAGGYTKSRTCNEDNLYSLQCNEKEVTTISEIMGGTAFVASHADLKRFNEDASGYRILHLATHACIDDSDIGLNKIFLADGDLSQHELNNLKLNAELTVLSACNTGMGQLLKGEGMMSLTRSFMLAGSQSILTSLWSVDDCATSDIMVEYYKCLKKGMTKDAAIANAKLNYLKTADRNNSHPYYWGAFVQFGNVDAIENGWDNLYLILFFATILLLSFSIFGYLKYKKLRTS
ncbi:MAG: CHAT domain-containing protein [Bacteroidota bacterium]